MSYKVFLWGFDSKLVRNAMAKLEQDGIIDIQKWFVDESLINDSFFSCRKEAEIYWGYKWKREKFAMATHVYPPASISDYIYKHIIMILHNLNRFTDTFRIPMHESLNIIWQLVNYYYTLLTEKKPDIIVFVNVPHFVDGTVLYIVAKAMSVKTLFFAPTSFEKKLSYCFSLSDYGKFHDVPVFDKKIAESVFVEKKFEKNLPYMSEAQIKHDMGLDKSWNSRLRAFFSPVSWFRDRIQLISQGGNKYEDINEHLEIKLIKLINKHFLEKNYLRRLHSLSKNSCDFSQPYVYFPLHLQPEMTTDTIGGIYTDQLLALEQLRRILPIDWKIYVKENPKQKSYKRGKEFFNRLSTIPDTILLDRTVDTYKLTASAKFVATITGTAAWEAVSGGKPALVFGHNWYDELPGIFHYHDDINANEIASFHIDHKKLEAKVADCMKKMVSLVLYEDMLLGIKDFDQAENEKNIYQFFIFILPYVK